MNMITILSVLGVAFLVFLGISFYFKAHLDEKITKSGKETTAVISKRELYSSEVGRLDATRVWVSYQDDNGAEHEAMLNSLDYRLLEGVLVTIKYLPKYYNRVVLVSVDEESYQTAAARMESEKAIEESNGQEVDTEDTINSLVEESAAETEF